MDGAGESAVAQQRLSSMRTWAGVRLLEKSVEACWLPLTPEHGFPSLLRLRTQDAPPPSVPGTIRAALAHSFPKENEIDPSGRAKCTCPCIFLPELSHWMEKQKAPCRSLLTKIQAFAVKTPYGGIVHIRWRVEACASSQPNGSPVFRSDYSAILRLCQGRSIVFDKNTPGFHRNFTFVCQNRMVWLGKACKFSPQMLNVV